VTGRTTGHKRTGLTDRPGDRVTIGRVSRSVVVRWSSGLTFEASSGMGGRVDLVGDETAVGLRPTEAMLAALASCTAMDVIAICAKKRQPIDGYEVEVTGEQRAAHPRFFEEIDVEHRFEGSAIDDVAVARSIELSATRYCPVSAHLASGQTRIRHRYRIRDGAGDRAADVVTTGPFGAGLDLASGGGQPGTVTPGSERSDGPT
jgi:putative redox protein